MILMLYVKFKKVFTVCAKFMQPLMYSCVTAFVSHVAFMLLNQLIPH